MDEILKTLVQIPSVTGDARAINPAIEYIDRFLSERGLHVKRFERGGVESIVATTQKTKAPKVLLAAHVDVVPAPDEQFNFREENGRYYGRGVFDMKFAIAAYLQLIDDLNGSLADYDIGLMITSDEELGGFSGTDELVKEGYLPDVVILPDAGDTPENWKLERSAKGALALEISTFGKTAHGSRPWKGDNAIDKLIMLLDEIRTLFKDQGHDTSTLTVSTILGGTACNQVPDMATTQLDIRVINAEDDTRIRRQVDQICEKYGAEYNPIFEWPAYGVDIRSPFVKRFISCVKEVTGAEPVESVSTGASDGRYFAWAGVPYIVAGPPGDGFHAAHEWVSKEGVEQLKDVLRIYVDQTAKTPKRQKQKQTAVV